MVAHHATRSISVVPGRRKEMLVGTEFADASRGRVAVQRHPAVKERTMKREKRNPFRLPDRLVITALHLAVAGSLACSGETKSAPADASGDVNATDATADATGNDSAPPDTATLDNAIADTAVIDSTVADGSSGDVVTQDSSGDVQMGDACVVTGFCGPMPGVDAAACPGPICDPSQCPLDAGCEPFA